MREDCEYHLRIHISSRDHFRQPPAHILDIIASGLVTNSPDELGRVLLEIVEHYSGKHRPRRADIMSIVQHIQSCPYGVSYYRPTVPMSYSYPHRGLYLTVRHIQDNGSVLVHAQYFSTALTKTPYGQGALTHFGPDMVSKLELWPYIDRSRALDVARQWIAELEKRFPGAVRVLHPDVLVRCRALIRVVDDDGIMMLFNYPPRLLLATPIGWFTVDPTSRPSTSIFGLLRSAGIPYPRAKQARRWTDDLGLQLLLTFKLLSGSSADTGGGS